MDASLAANASSDLARANAQPSLATIDNALEEKDRKQIWDFLSGPGWQFGWKSDPKKDAYSFWHKHFAGNELPDHYARDGKERPHDCAAELRQTAPILHQLWTDLAKQALPGHTLTRCYANGQPYGTEGSIHTDSLSDKSRTVIYYPNAVWHPNWGGETLFFNNERSDVFACVYPRPNRLVVFSGTIPHVARGVSRVCPHLRITLMFKTERALVSERHRKFLIDELKLGQVPHSQRDFYTHLTGTYELLKAWGNPEPVCLAGLFHSIYGTLHFRYKAFPADQREVISDLIGEEAETLVYAFCVIDRPKVLIASIEASDIEVMDQHAKKPLRLSRAQLDHLLEIEAANLLEQLGNVRFPLEQILNSNIGVAAKRAISQHLDSTT